jgi:hypothetical protein
MVINGKYNMPNQYVDGKDLRYIGLSYDSSGRWHNFAEWEDPEEKVWMQCKSKDHVFKSLKYVEVSDDERGSNC